MINLQDEHYTDIYRVTKRLEAALERIKKLEQENVEWRDLLSKLKNFNEWKRWKMGE